MNLENRKKPGYTKFIVFAFVLGLEMRYSLDKGPDCLRRKTRWRNQAYIAGFVYGSLNRN